MHDETHRALTDLSVRHIKKLAKTWASANRELQRAIFDSYRAVAPRGSWSLPLLRMSGIGDQLRMKIRSTMEAFHADSTYQMRFAFKHIRTASILRHGWLLDQITPHSRKIKLPPIVMTEAVRLRTYADWDQRWSLWCDAYSSSLMNNLALNAINDGDIQSAMDETDATKAGSPAYSIYDSLVRIFEYEAVRNMAEGEDEIAQMNDDLVQTEVWRTRGDLNVCDECDLNDGLTVDEADGDIPLHPNCHCFWEIVPESYAKLLRSGSPDDQALAREMQVRGLVPNSMVIRDTEGNVMGKMIVDFADWVEGQSHSIMGGVK